MPGDGPCPFNCICPLLVGRKLFIGGGIPLLEASSVDLSGDLFITSRFRQCEMIFGAVDGNGGGIFFLSDALDVLLLPKLFAFTVSVSELELVSLVLVAASRTVGGCLLSVCAPFSLFDGFAVALESVSWSDRTCSPSCLDTPSSHLRMLLRFSPQFLQPAFGVLSVEQPGQPAHEFLCWDSSSVMAPMVLSVVSGSMDLLALSFAIWCSSGITISDGW